MYDPFRKHTSVVHTGHIGDIIAFIPVFRLMNATRIIVKDGEHMEPMTGFKFDTMKPLLESQGIQVYLNDGTQVINYDMTGWRECYRDDINLIDSQARFANVVNRYNGHFEINEPWLKVDPDENGKGRVIFNRSHRYRNDKFPWKDISNHFGKRAMFVGTVNEHDDFVNNFGPIEYYRTPSCLEVAKVIAASDFYVGNQSSSFLIAAGLMKPLLQEVFPPAPNSVVAYNGACYCFDGNVDYNSLEK